MMIKPFKTEVKTKKLGAGGWGPGRDVSPKIKSNGN